MTDAEKLAAVREIFDRFDWETDDRQYALEQIENIVTDDGPAAAGHCVHCAAPVETTTLYELIAGGGFRSVRVLVHTGAHEQCAGADTFAELAP